MDVKGYSYHMRRLEHTDGTIKQQGDVNIYQVEFTEVVTLLENQLCLLAVSETDIVDEQLPTHDEEEHFV